jgi:hypothetical protein
MTQREACRTVLFVLAAFLMASTGFAQEPRGGQVAERMSARERAVLAASIPRREAELAQRQREDVLAEVEVRAREMGVRASVEELTDLLFQRAHLQIGLDKCQLGEGDAASCRAVEKKLARVEASFRDRAGLSAREFQGGRRDTPPPADKLRPLSQTKSQTCTCTLSIYSDDRWMNPWWGLEVGGHASHGVCSNDVDWSWPHGPGSGAMTGDIDIYLGSYHQRKTCEDDHITCFHGPSTSNPGEWGNVSSCDTWHSQFYNPFGPFYGGALSDSLWVHQVSTPYFTVAGSCDGAHVTVSEYIKEHDPSCCDDPMGTLWATVPVSNGSGNSSAQASYQNCNGGSQSGVYPHCGTFGATIWVAYICQTNGTAPPPPPTCDPQEEQACWNMGGNWSSSTCTCYQDPCYQYSSAKRPYCP